VLEARPLAAGIFSVWVEQPAVARRARPGQFLNVRVSPGPDPLLRRPISVADVEDNRLRLVFQVKGRGTAAMAGLRRGDSLDVLGPLGKPALIPRNRDVFLVGGGVGAAPLLFLCRRVARGNRVRVFLGVRTREQVILLRDFRALRVPLHLATDDGSLGHKGFVAELAEADIRAAPRPMIFSCGPRPMLADLVRRLDPTPVWGYVEERMGCGTGICYCCALPKKDGGYVRFCEEGPVVRLNEVKL
jgi:dihydroorotate dehydrogenase electron transfer subunit